LAATAAAARSDSVRAVWLSIWIHCARRRQARRRISDPCVGAGIRLLFFYRVSGEDGRDVERCARLRMTREHTNDRERERPVWSEMCPRRCASGSHRGEGMDHGGETRGWSRGERETSRGAEARRPPFQCAVRKGGAPVHSCRGETRGQSVCSPSRTPVIVRGTVDSWHLPMTASLDFRAMGGAVQRYAGNARTCKGVQETARKVAWYAEHPASRSHRAREFLPFLQSGRVTRVQFLPVVTP